MDKLSQLVESKYGPIRGPVGWTMKKKPWAPPPVKTYTMKPGGESQDKFNLPGKQNTFGNAFANARKQGLKEFTWNNKKYNTKLKGETTAPKIEMTDIPAPKGIDRQMGKKNFIVNKVSTPGSSKPVAAPPAQELKSKLMAKKAEYVFEKISKKCKGKKSVKW